MAQAEIIQFLKRNEGWWDSSTIAKRLGKGSSTVTRGLLALTKNNRRFIGKARVNGRIVYSCKLHL